MDATRRRPAGARLTAVCAVATLGLVAGACSDDDDGDDAAAATDVATTAASTDTTEVSSDTTAPATTAAPDDTAPETTEASTDTTAAGDEGGDAYDVFPTLDPPSGEPIVIGLVNTEGAPGLDFPDIRLAVEGTADYLDQHGGVGGRPIQLETCVASGAPDTSQACAQELAGKGVELVLLGLDLFPDYATYTAAGIPVIGMLPILPGDYTADALFLTGGNATSMAAIAGVAADHFDATTVGVVSADNAGANSSLAALTAALDALGVTWTSVKGGDNETDAGFQGLMREAAAGDPDVLVSLYADAGCIGTMRGRASLGIEIPVLTTGICRGAEVLDQVGDDALGWNFVGVATQEDTPELAILQDIMAPVLDVAPEEVDSTALGLGGLGLTMMMTIAVLGNQLADAGSDVTGASIAELLATGDDLSSWPGTAPLDCGAAPTYPAVCAFIFPVAEYLEGGDVRTIPGLEAVSALEYLP
jgi:branched-chain amino acid transport system substrate-binding protein